MVMGITNRDDSGEVMIKIRCTMAIGDVMKKVWTMNMTMKMMSKWNCLTTSPSQSELIGNSKKYLPMIRPIMAKKVENSQMMLASLSKKCKSEMTK